MLKQNAKSKGLVVVIGGNGGMGGLFVGKFAASGYETRVLEKDDWPGAEKIVEGARAVIVSVPISATIQVIEALPELPPGCVLADLTSVKQAPLKAMLEKHNGPVIGLHPMFGPMVSNVSGHRLIYCNGRQAARCAWLLAQFAQWGLKPLAARPEEHDKNMALIQGLRHFMLFSLGAFIWRGNYDLSLLLDMASPAFHIDMAQMGRLFSQNGQLCADIMSTDKSLGLLDEFYQYAGELLSILQRHDEAGAMELFDSVSQWLGIYGEKLNQQSQALDAFMH